MTGRETLAGRYELRGLLGCGGMAEVRDGWDTRLQRPVAVKLLHPSLNADPVARQRFAAEARAAAGLSHPGIVAVHDFGDYDGRPFIVMERLPGHTLADVLARGPLPPAQVRSVLDDILAALEVAHAAGVLHRDIKPGNILVSAAGDRMQVADFGIAKSGTTAHTATGQIIGTLNYLSPERITGAPASVADDLYAVGVIGYEALLGRRAFPQDNPAALAWAITDGPPPSAGMVAGADPALTAVIDRAMSRDPHLRFGSAAQMRAALTGDAAAWSVGAGVPRPATRVLTAAMPQPVPDEAPRRPMSRTRKYALGAGLLSAFAVSAIALAMDPFSSSAPAEPVSTSTTAPAPPPVTTPAPSQVVSTAPVLPQQPEQNNGPPGKGERQGKPGKGNGKGPGNGNGPGNGGGPGRGGP